MSKFIKVLSVFILLIAVLFFLLYEEDISLEEAKAVLVNENSEFVEIDGMQVHYRREGQGFPIVLIHGTSAMLQAWDGWVPELINNGFEVIRMDLPGFGLTGAIPSNDYTVDYYVSFIETFTKALAVDSFHIAGSSLGGQIAVEYAVDFSEKINKMVLLDPGGMGEFDESSQNDVMSRLLENRFVLNNFKKIGTKYLVKQAMGRSRFSGESITEEQIKAYHVATLREGNRAAFVQRALTEDSPSLEGMKRLGTPILLLWGKEDIEVPIRQADYFLQYLPNVELIKYEAVGHVPMEEIPEQSVQDAIQFMNGFDRF